MKKYIVLSILWSSFFVQIWAQIPNNALQQLKVDVVYLASDLLEGREVGKKGEEQAAAYIASRFAAIGLLPKGDAGGWFQHFEFSFNANPHGTGTLESRKGKNVVGYIDHKAPTTVIIGAHYDHLGFGGAGNSRNTGEPAIHNGADDNASGVAALLFVAEELKRSKIKKNNYLFLAFSAEELGLIGSKKFIEAKSIDLKKVNYMINMDMVGRLNEEKVLAVNGSGTSPIWPTALTKVNSSMLKIKTSESGLGPSDHASFYVQDIPVLHFFTGQHADYHKPSDDSERINYEGLSEVATYILALVKELDGKGKLMFTKTKDEQPQATRFKVSLGVMPDYVYDGEGLRIDGVMEGRPAQKAGLEKGDVLIQIADLPIKTVQDYMAALGKFNKGDQVVVRVKRGEGIIERSVTF